MAKKKLLICVLIVLIALISFVSIIMFNACLKKSNNSTANTAINKEDTDETKEGYYEIEPAYIQLEYPNKISYPEMRKFDVIISNCPVVVSYCKIAVDFGNISKNKIYLEKENKITYNFADNFEGLTDIISFEFYDENAQFIADSKIAVQYDKDEKNFQIFEIKME